MKPLNNWTITSPFGPRFIFGKMQPHEGVDLISPDRRVFAVADGTVLTAKFDREAGNLIRLGHYGYHTRYLHLDSMSVQVGDQVKAGQQIGIYGATGRVTGPHLHFDLYVDGVRVDPEPYLRGDRSMEVLEVKLHGKVVGIAKMDGSTAVLDTPARSMLVRLGYDVVDWAPEQLTIRPNLKKMMQIINQEIKEE